MNRFEELAHPEAPTPPRPGDVVEVDLPEGVPFKEGCERILAAVEGNRRWYRRPRWVEVRVGGVPVCVTTPAVVATALEERHATGPRGPVGRPGHHLIVPNAGHALLGEEEGRPRTVTYVCPEQGCGRAETLFRPGAPVCEDHGVGMVER
ncbi:hypothetical protein [Streptomyces alkaliphilus]|uniref:hypothetical protein n=1 Tax=Streptomyces alkaliphilus TaxID=1472722 RepID=UPI00117FF842|nr:hypothetical protein [Streptomyces alkaliphilus]MQS09001.1 hypothetical protein [Streptomyces alkaliphilus]